MAFTSTAAATGAIPVPMASAVIVAENAVMIAMIASQLAVPITPSVVIESLGFASTVNAIGRAVFVECARALGWFAGPAGVAGICALGATTAGLQTWIVGCLAIEIGKNSGRALTPALARGFVRSAEASYKALRLTTT